MSSIFKMMALACLAVGVVSACSQDASDSASTPEPPAAATAPAIPEAVNGWREYPLRDGVISIQPVKWRRDTIDIPVAARDELEYKLSMKKGQGIVYTITYGDLQHPGMMVTEFHGHTEKGADGVGDLMFYSKTGGTAESGVFNAPWDGIHGWYLKNDSEKDVVVKLEVAGFYERTDETPK
ncbi:MAG TPA: hypothetical protein VIA80_18390 [Hyphomonadaceae bacterium]|jgi:hypothetical protein